MPSFFSSLLDDGEDVFLADDEVLFTVDLHLRAGVLAEQHAVALLHLEGDDLAVVGEPAGADRDHLGLLRLLLGGVGDDDPALRLGFFLDALDEDAVMQRTHLHGKQNLRSPAADLGRRTALLGVDPACAGSWHSAPPTAKARAMYREQYVGQGDFG